MNLTAILEGANVALHLLQARLITLIALILTMVLYGWAMCMQTWLGFTIALVWGLSIFLPILLIGRGGYDATAQRQPLDPEDSPADGGEA